MDVQIDIKKVTIEFNEEKNLLLRETRGIGFEEAIKAINNGNILDDRQHKNIKKYPKQRIIVVKIKNYVYAIPYIFNQKKRSIFLKTVYPSRVFTKKYLK
ncbi:hypothetical protein A3E73_00310 [Candidatus Beckwithbacteria bacterium RIFCSPHIGHO2_12_FULL_47_17]|uniref:Toxin n=1 Tax=Candidatus Beckwithbacteria bacterium RIFCSPHIGHO2_12_FULL_47_17 TaxID=1797460 RepID=A0A1F5DL59_9BACT|nr:MAG: hypothetical protein A3E73_00310 [Candidatus Beckwithbacteria bacterium RIFCSPHIGHO2_12_FULL_47_17]